MRTTANATVPFGVVAYANNEVGSQYGPQMASAVLATLPMLLAFLAFQREFVRGVGLSGGLQE